MNDLQPSDFAHTQPGGAAAPPPLASPSRLRAFAAGVWDVFIRLLPFLVGYLAFRVAGKTEVRSSNDHAIRDLGELMQWALGFIAAIAAYTLIGEVTLRRLPSRIATEVAVTSRAISGLKDDVEHLRDLAHEQIRVVTALKGVEIVYELDDALQRARKLQASASGSVHAMWTLLPYDDALRAYFAETLARGEPALFTARVVAARTVKRQHLLDHIEQSWDHLASAQYELFVVPDCHFEAMVVDHDRAGLFFNTERGYGSCYISVSTKEFTRMVEGLFTALMRPEHRLPVDRDAPYEIDKISAWLDNYYH